MRFFALSLSAALATAGTCQPPTTTPPAGPSGSGGVVVSGTAGAPPEPIPVKGQGGAGGYVPGGAGAPQGPAAEPLCVLPRPPWAQTDPDLATLRAAIPGALASAGPAFPATAPGWLAYREPIFGAPPPPRPATTLVLVPPVGMGTAALELVRAHLVTAAGAPLGGHVTAPAEGCATCGVRNPCGDAPARVLAVAIDVPALPGAAPAKARPQAAR